MSPIGPASRSIVQRRTGRDEPGQLRSRAGRAIHRGLRRAAARRHAAEHRGTGIRESRRQQLSVRHEWRLAARGKRAARGDRLREAHERDAKRAGPEHRCQGEVRCDERRKSPRNITDGCDSGGLQPQQAHRRDTRGNRDQRGRRAGEKSVQAHKQHDRAETNGDRGQRGIRDRTDRGDHVVKKTTLVDMDPE
jgi:hypothetical protein